MEQIPNFQRPKPLSSGAERDQLDSWLAFYRATLLKKCAELSFEDLCRRPVATSTMSLLGILRHMTFVEQIWFDVRFAGNDVTEYYRSPDDREAEWNELESASLDEVVTSFEHACETSDRARARPRPRRNGSSTRCWARARRLALDLLAHDRGVRASLRTRRFDSRNDRRNDWVLAVSTRTAMSNAQVPHR